MRRSIYGLTAMAGRQELALLASCGGTAMQNHTNHWEERLPMTSTLTRNIVPPQGVNDFRGQSFPVKGTQFSRWGDSPRE